METMSITESDLTELDLKLLKTYRLLNEDEKEIIDLIMLLYKEAHRKKIDPLTYSDHIEYLMGKSNGNFRELKEYLIGLLLELKRDT